MNNKVGYDLFKTHQHIAHEAFTQTDAGSYLDFIKNVFQSTQFKIIASIGVTAIGVGYFAKWYRKHKRNVKRKSYPKDIVILHQFPRGLRAPNLSPFAVKLETWLRMADIPYQNEFTFELSEEGESPWVTYNAFEIPDAQLAIEYLSNRLDKDLNKNLTLEQKAIARAFRILGEESLRWVITLHRLVYHPDQEEIGLSWIWLSILPFKAKKAAYYQGYGRHTKEEVYEIGRTSLKSIDDFIGSKKFLMGDEVCDADAALFGVLCQVKYHDRGPLNIYLVQYCKNILRYIEAIKQIYWQDWNANINERPTAVPSQA